MPRVFDNIEPQLLPVLRGSLEQSQRADFYVGYLNLRGWRLIDDLIDRYPGGAKRQCRALVGMQRLPQGELRSATSLASADAGIEQQAALQLKKRTAEEIHGFRSTQSQLITDEIDRVLSKHYGFTDEELDFSINYDIKYRMGRDNGDEDDGEE